MFKRVERKRKRKEEEEALGLDEETKEVLGLNDTDSDESASSGDDSSDNEDAEGADVGAEEEEGVSEEDDSEDEDEEATIPIRTALTNPIYVVAIEPTTTHSCAVCPGRILKGSQMLEVHNTSKACSYLSQPHALVEHKLTCVPGSPPAIKAIQSQSITS